MQKGNRVFTPRQPGIPKKSKAPFWRGKTAEALVTKRAAQNLAEKAARRKNPSARGPLPLNRQLSRLRRALPRRKTLEARVRIQARIDEILKEMGQ